MKEDILTKALEQALDESFNEMIDQDIPDYAFSPEFKEKMDVLIHDQQTVPEKKRSRMLWFSAMAAAAALICVTAGLTYNYRPKRIHEPQNDFITEDDTNTSPTTQNGSVPAVTGTTGETSAAATSASSSMMITSQTSVTTAKAVTENTGREEQSRDNTEAASISISAAERNRTTTAKPATTASEASATTSYAAAASTTAAIRQTTTSALTYHATTEAYVTTTNYQTQFCTSAPPVTSTMIFTSAPPSTTTSINNPSEERSTYVKKLSAILASILAANPLAVPEPSYPPADSSTVISGSSPFLYPTEYEEYGSLHSLTELHENESVLDVNKDGAFDIEDVYSMACSLHYENFKSPEKYDFSGLTKIETDEERNELKLPAYDLYDVYKYYATYNTITAEHLSEEPFRSFCRGNIDFSAYDDVEEAFDELYKDYLKGFTAGVASVYQFYDLFKTTTIEKNVDLDVSGDGVFNIDDIYYFSMLDNTITGYDPCDYYRFKSVIEYPEADGLPQDIAERCAAVMKQYEYNRTYPMKESIHRYMLLYYLEDHPFDPAFSAIEFYEENFREIEDICRPSFYLLLAVDPLQSNLGFGHNDMRYGSVDCSPDNIAKEYEEFKKLAESPGYTVPDINSDGLYDIADFRLALMFFDQYRFKKEIPFPEEYRQTFLNELDLNQNKVCGDINDIALYQLYIGEVLGLDEDNYLEAIINYYLEHPDFDPEHSGHYRTTTLIYLSDEESYSLYTQYREKVDSGILPKPDVDLDGDVDLNDYLFARIISNYISYNDNIRMSIISDEILNNFTETFDLDGDGKVSTQIDVDLLESYVADDMGYDVQYPESIDQFIKDNYEIQLSLYDDVLPEGEGSMYSLLVPEKVKDFTYEQKKSILMTSEFDENYIESFKEDRYMAEVDTDSIKDTLDINMDGTVDAEDYILSHVFHNLYFKNKNFMDRGTELITDVAETRFIECFDLNGNGVSGDDADMQYGDYYFSRYLGTLVTDYEFWIEYDQKAEKAEHDREVIQIADEKRNGDANVDGNTDISDSVIIMQSYANPSKYQLTDKGKFNG
ncbi:MAG: hypothetical protein KBA55_14570, partial [Ruminococcus sp.]|nr:hypothetical protein [Ruminococcus sp.]